MQAIPSAIEVEKPVLGAIMLDGLTAMEQCLRLRPEHFYLTAHRTVFRTCQELLAKQDDISPQLVIEHIGKGADPAYVSDLPSGLYRGFNPSVRVDTIIEKWKLRRGLELCGSYSAAFASESPSEDTLATLQADVLDIIQESTEFDDPHVSAYSEIERERFLEEAANCEMTTGLSFGLPRLDRWTNGMQPGEVTVVGARSGVGKSALMKQAAFVNAAQGIPVVLFSLEMSRGQIQRGLWSIVSEVDYKKCARPNRCDPDERDHVVQRVLNASRTIDAWPLRIYDKSDMNIDQIVAFARMHVRRHGARLICVDYAQNVETEGREERLKVAAVSKKLTKMAKAEGCHVMLLSQLRKVSQEHYGYPPTAADLRETGQLENDAHVVVLLHRGWDTERNCIPETASIIIPKMRSGRTGAFPATFNPKNLCFESETYSNGGLDEQSA